MRDLELEVVETARFSVLCVRKHRQKWFGRSMSRFTRQSPRIDFGDPAVRALMAPHLRKMRSARGSVDGDFAETATFSFDASAHALDAALRECLGVAELSEVHDGGASVEETTVAWKRRLLAPLLDASRRRRFEELFHGWMLVVALPAVAPTGCEVARYQNFPCVRVHCPGEVTIGPHCDAQYGHDPRTVNVHLPLTAAYGTNALVVEHRVAAEDFEPLEARAFGAAFAFVGGAAAHFTTENTTRHTRCSIDARVRCFGDADDIYERDGYFAKATKRGGVWVRQTPRVEPDARVGLPWTRAAAAAAGA